MCAHPAQHRFQRGSIVEFPLVCCSQIGVPRWTPGKVKFVLPPRQSRGVSRLPLAEDPKISWVDDTEVVRDRIADEAPVFGHGFCQESHYGRLEVSECEVALVVGEVSVHDAPQPRCGVCFPRHGLIKGCRRYLFVFLENRAVPPTNNGSEQALRPTVIFRKVTNCFRSEWAPASMPTFVPSSKPHEDEQLAPFTPSD